MDAAVSKLEETLKLLRALLHTFTDELPEGITQLHVHRLFRHAIDIVNGGRKIKILKVGRNENFKLTGTVNRMNAIGGHDEFEIAGFPDEALLDLDLTDFGETFRSIKALLEIKPYHSLSKSEILASKEQLYGEMATLAQMDAQTNPSNRNALFGALTDLVTITVCCKTGDREYTLLPAASGYRDYVNYVLFLLCKHDQSTIQSLIQLNKAMKKKDSDTKEEDGDESGGNGDELGGSTGGDKGKHNEDKKENKGDKKKNDKENLANHRRMCLKNAEVGSSIELSLTSTKENVANADIDRDFFKEVNTKYLKNMQYLQGNEKIRWLSYR
jgi:hypothetical protein